ncbi:hypothetical protein C8T65DRAFT_648447 [Cerioporus squamosus]|nr:hypothetical protein C8T65DRAFT_648447 [Cerioporus squamosus]
MPKTWTTLTTLLSLRSSAVCPRRYVSSKDYAVSPAADNAVQIQSSPEKAPATGRDGLMRLGAGAGGGFDLDDEDDITLDEVIRLLRRAAEILEEQQEEADPRFINNAKRRMRGVLTWARNIEQHIARRTLPKTNARGRKEGPAAIDVVGYRYQESR